MYVIGRRYAAAVCGMEINVKEVNVAFAGNPNCGKTTLFNAYTGARLKVANWPGVTVEKKEGRIKLRSDTYKLIDLPGTYSLDSYTMEEKLTRQYLLEGDADVVIDVADASNLERNLYLTIQLIELGKPVVLALNMMDIVEERGMKINTRRLSERLGIPVVPVSARKRRGLDTLISAAADMYNKPPLHNVMVYSDRLEAKIYAVTALLEKRYPGLNNMRWYAVKLLEQDTEIQKRCPLDLSGIADKGLESEFINQKYNFIEKLIAETLVNKEKSELTDRADRILTDRIWGTPIFFLIMAAVFFLTFTVGDWIKGFFEGWLESFSAAARSLLIGAGADELVISLIVDGVIAGVGGVLTFLPNIFILFLALAFLEDSGYMSRVAYVMDGIMGGIGLSGRAFIPMLLGFGCSVPAIMATRTLEKRRDRLRTMLVVPFMSCSARLPVYVLLSDMFFGKYAVFAAYSMYIIGVCAAVCMLFIISKLQKGSNNGLLIELPEYKTPNARTIAVYVWEKLADYLQKAGTIIFLASIAIWLLLNFGRHGMTDNIGESLAAAAGRAIAPALAPAGLGFWQIAVALITGFMAKEAVISTLGVLYASAAIPLSGVLTSMLSPASAFALMVFVLLYTPCVATLTAMRRESGSAKYTLFMMLYQLGVAWLVSFIIYQLLSIFI